MPKKLGQSRNTALPSDENSDLAGSVCDGEYSAVDHTESITKRDTGNKLKPIQHPPNNTYTPHFLPFKRGHTFSDEYNQYIIIHT